MACLSWQRNGFGSFTIAANIYPLTDLSSPPSSSIDYEVLQPEANTLLEHVGTSHRFYIDERTGTFLAKIGPLKPITSTHPGLAMLRGEPTWRGCLEIIDPPTAV